MSKRLLIETRLNSLSLCEGVKPSRPGCLGTIAGPCADYKDPTRNGNFYSRKLWENVFKDPLVKESLEDKVLLGELDHPGDRLETKAANAAIVMTSYEFDDANSTVNGVFDILDTPNGRILKSLLDYGCKIGVSSRGEGDVVTKDGVDNVDEESYYFVGFDAVALPAVKKAKPALQESLKRETLKESLRSQIESATTVTELDTIKRVVEAAQLPDLDSILESIENKSKELEGVNDSSNLMEDLERQNSLINDLTEEVKSLKQDVANGESRVKRFIESRVKMSEELGDISDKYETLTEDYNKVVFQYSATSKKVESLESELTNARDVIEGLREELRTARSLNSDHESKISSLEESLERSQSASRRKSDEIQHLREELEQTTGELARQKKESAEKMSAAQKRNAELKSSLSESKKSGQSMLRSYAESRSKDLGVSSKRVVESLKPGMTTAEVDKLLDEEVSRSDRYRKMTLINDHTLNSITEGKVTLSRGTTPLDPESAQTVEFMEQFYRTRK